MVPISNRMTSSRYAYRSPYEVNYFARKHGLTAAEARQAGERQWRKGQ
jgi:hypothetical protein